MTDWHPKDVASAPVRRGETSGGIVDFTMRLATMLLATCGSQHIEQTADSLFVPAPGPSARINGAPVDRAHLLGWWRTTQVENYQAVKFISSSDEPSAWIAQVCSTDAGDERGTLEFSATSADQVARNVSMSVCVQFVATESHLSFRGGGASAEIVAVDIVAPERNFRVQMDSQA
ncbi:hypothetical protein EXIGLDRAFT_729190 [Exidia glandulosa HHB12029]|uniref:Uncharacterized protein n=1 Tax=Exidia glandulosa HHB12029 TaxID=1314781 RepID=A0A165LLP5_EXIGL|nr:hypothetical protein EXIGLDRAFT_729190 [Exidia glandulosa HHB12029]